MNMTDMVELQELKKEVGDYRARRNFVSELLAEIAMTAVSNAEEFEDDTEPKRVALEYIEEVAVWAMDILDNGFEGSLDEEYNALSQPKEPLGFEEEDLFKYRS